MRVKEFMELYSDSNFHFMTSKGYLFLPVHVLWLGQSRMFISEF